MIQNDGSCVVYEPADTQQKGNGTVRTLSSKISTKMKVKRIKAKMADPNWKPTKFMRGHMERSLRFFELALASPTSIESDEDVDFYLDGDEDVDN